MNVPGTPLEGPYSSFQWPVILPTVEPDSGPLFHVCFSLAWQPWILGCMRQLLQSTTWKTADQSELDLVIGRSEQLLYMFQVECPLIPAGTIVAFGGATVPDEWLLCDGSEISRTDYAGLFDALGTTWGMGDGSTTFGLPDLRGSAPIGAGTGSGLTNRTLGDYLGEEEHTLTGTEAPTHSHIDAGHTHSEGNAVPSLGAAIVGVPVPSAIPGIGVTGIGSASIGNSGGGGAHNNIQPSAVVNFLIKT